MPYSNEYDAIPICRTHARSLCVHPNFQATTRATSDNFVACRSRCRSLCVHTLIIMMSSGNTARTLHTVNSKINGTPKGVYKLAHFEATFDFNRSEVFLTQ